MSWGFTAGPPIPNGRPQAGAAALGALSIVAAYRSLGGTPDPAAALTA
jgi:hypothetical protein